MEQEFQMDMDDGVESQSPDIHDTQLNHTKVMLYNLKPSGGNNSGLTSRYHSDDEVLDEPENLEGDGEFNGYVDDSTMINEGSSAGNSKEKERTSKDVGNGDIRVRKGVTLKKVLKDLDYEMRYTDLEDHSTDQREEYSPPENFSLVVGQIYRSSFPRAENFSYLKKLKLKTILFLVPEEYPEENMKFAKENDINVFQVSMSGNKEPFVKIPDEVLTRALEIAINPANHPLLIHCNRGKHRTGCLVGCIRRLQNWSLTMILDEYRRFAAPKIRPLDQQFIELYNDEEIRKTAQKEGFLPIQW